MDGVAIDGLLKKFQCSEMTHISNNNTGPDFLMELNDLTSIPLTLVNASVSSVGQLHTHGRMCVTANDPALLMQTMHKYAVRLLIEDRNVPNEVFNRTVVSAFAHIQDIGQGMMSKLATQ